MLFRKVKEKRAKRALADGNEEAPPPYQQIRKDKHVCQSTKNQYVSKRSFSSGRAYYSAMDHNDCRIPDVTLHKGNVYYWARD